MIPAGYMLKKIVPKPDWISAANVEDIYSLGGCISEYFTDYIPCWKHNGFWLFNSIGTAQEIARMYRIDIAETTAFYYEVFEEEFDEGSREWSTFEPEHSFVTDVRKPAIRRLEGYDVTAFGVRTGPECSPLSCCNLAAELAVNRHCLFNSFEQAKRSLEAGWFDDSEPGPFRIFAVYTVQAPSSTGQGSSGLRRS